MLVTSTPGPSNDPTPASRFQSRLAPYLEIADLEFKQVLVEFDHPIDVPLSAGVRSEAVLQSR